MAEINNKIGAVAKTIEICGVLTIIVIIRTFLSFSLEVEIKGSWPWQHHENTKQS